MPSHVYATNMYFNCILFIMFQAFEEVSALLKFILQRGKDFFYSASHVLGIKHLDIFGMYYILDASKTEKKCSVLPAEEAAVILRINDYESLRHMQSQYLINVSRNIM